MTSKLTQRITKYVLKRNATTLTELEGVVLSAGFTEAELYAALELVHRDKRILQTSTQAGEITYRPANAKVVTDHLAWVRENYPWPDEFVMPFPEIDYSWIVMSPDEAKEYKAAASGRPAYMMKTYKNKK